MIHSHDIHANMLLILLLFSAAFNILKVLLDSLDESRLSRFARTNQTKVSVDYCSRVGIWWPGMCDSPIARECRKPLKLNLWSAT